MHLRHKEFQTEVLLFANVVYYSKVVIWFSQPAECFFVYFDRKVLCLTHIKLRIYIAFFVL